MSSAEVGRLTTAAATCRYCARRENLRATARIALLVARS